MERSNLQAAREHLAAAEANYRNDAARVQLEDGLSLLEDVLLEGAPQDRAVATNLATTYAERMVNGVAHAIEDPALPEPELERLFKLLLVFDDFDFEPPQSATQLKLEIAKRLIDRYLEGHDQAEKDVAVQQLLQLAAPR